MQSRGSLVAMIQGPDNKTYIVHQGDKLLDGTIKTVTPQGLVELMAGTRVDLEFPDRNPDDMRRVTITVTWTSRGQTRTVRQAGVFFNPGNASRSALPGAPIAGFMLRMGCL